MTHQLPSPYPISGFTLFSAVLGAIFVGMVDQTMVGAALPAMAASFGDVGKVSWVVVVYLGTSAIAAPVYGRLGDALGRRRFTVVALTVSLIGSVLCSVASSFEMLLLARAIQGAGGGGLISLSFALVRQSVEESQHVKYQSRLSAIAVCASAIGPVLGGFITEYLGWRWVFVFNIPITLLAMILIHRLPRRFRPIDAVHFDYAGFFLLSVSIAALLVAIEHFRRIEEANLVVALVILGVSFAAFAMLFWIETKAEKPIVPIELFRNLAIRRAESLAVVHGALLVSLMTFSPIYFGVVRHTSADMIGVLLLPLVVGIGFGSIVTGTLIGWTGRASLYPTTGMAISAGILLALSFWAPNLPSLAISVVFGVISMLLGPVMVVVHSVVLAEAGINSLGAASGSVALARGIGASVGTAVVSLVLFVVSRGVPIDGTLLENGSFAAVFLTLAVFALLGSIIAWRIPQRAK